MPPTQSRCASPRSPTAAAAAARSRPACCSRSSPRRARRCCPRSCWSASRPPTTPRSTRSTTGRRSSRPPISSCRSSTIRSTSAPSRRPTRSPTSTRWAARRCSRWRWSACRSTSCPSTRSARSSKAASRSARKAGIPIAGGHTIDSVEPIYGLVAIGLVDPRNLKRNAGARPGDVLILGKPLGVGIYSAALKKEKLSRDGYAAMIASTTQLNTPGIALGQLPARACADRRHRLRPARPPARDLPRLRRRRHDRLRAASAASGRARARARGPFHRRLRPQLGRATATMSISAHARATRERALLTDPQTSGGLLVACAPDAVADVLAIFRDEGFGAGRGDRRDDRRRAARGRALTLAT